MAIDVSTTRLSEPTNLEDQGLKDYLYQLLRELEFNFEDLITSLITLSTSGLTVTTITTTPVTLDANFNVILVDDDTIGGVATINLPSASENTGRVYEIKKIGSTANVIIDGASSETIDGAITLTLIAQYETVTLYCDGTEWFIL